MEGAPRRICQSFPCVDMWCSGIKLVPIAWARPIIISSGYLLGSGGDSGSRPLAHFVAAGGRHQAAIQWVLLVFQNGMNHLLAAGLMRQGCDYHLSEQQKAVPVRCLKPPGSEETRPQSTWFWKPSERTVWATPNRLPLAQAATQSCENKTSSRKS